MFIVFVSNAQSLTGPKAKNAKVSERTENAAAVVYYKQPSDLKGPAAKNSKVWKRSGSQALVSIRENPADKPKGLKAKNSKVWEDPELAVSSRASYILPKTMRPRKFWWH
ncbi:hypothetical protein JYB64_19240 [Algoriphagus aestuarii]|nr:hypothetical protein [Algoriphagus aestuarii]